MSNTANKPEHFRYLFDRSYKVVSSTSVAQVPEHRATETLWYLEDKVDIIVVQLEGDSIDLETFLLANVSNYTGVEFENVIIALNVF